VSARKIDTGRMNVNYVEAGAGTPIVFLHGLGWDNRLWTRQIERLAGRYRAIAPDTRGHGGTDVPPGPYSIDAYCEDFIAFIDAIKLDCFILVGFSQGGMTAQTFAVAHQDRLIGLVLASTTCRSHAAGAGNMERRIAAMRTDGPEAAARIALTSIFADEFVAANPAYIEQFIRLRVAMDADGLIAAMRAGQGYDVSEAIRALHVPTLVIAGAADRLTQPDSVHEVAKRIPGAEYRLVVGSGHMIPIEQPAAFDTLLDEFLVTLAVPAKAAAA